MSQLSLNSYVGVLPLWSALASAFMVKQITRHGKGNAISNDFTCYYSHSTIKLLEAESVIGVKIYSNIADSAQLHLRRLSTRSRDEVSQSAIARSFRL